RGIAGRFAQGGRRTIRHGACHRSRQDVRRCWRGDFRNGEKTRQYDHRNQRRGKGALDRSDQAGDRQLDQGGRGAQHRWRQASRGGEGVAREIRAGLKREHEMPKGYWIGHITVTNPEGYKEYVAANAEPLRKYGGRFLVRGGKYETRSGSERPRHVIVEFDSFEQAK